MKPTQPPRRLTGLTTTMLAVATVAACGGSSGGSRTGTGGTTSGAGGLSGSGGVSGSAGSGVGTGGAASGSGGAAPLACQTPTAAPATLTDFSDWNPISGKWGSANSILGGLFNYASTMSTLQVSVVDKPTAAGDKALHFVGNVVPAMTGGGYAGGGLSFDICATAAAYTGISFSVSGSTGGCALELQLQTYSTKPIANNGGCQSGCSSASKGNLTVPGTVTVSFSDLTGAAPTAFSSTELVGIQWQLTIPEGAPGAPQMPCPVDLYFDDVTFVK